MLLLYYFIIINVISFIAFYIDKRKAIKNLWRIKENHLHLLSLIGGAVGSISGMIVFRHKTRKTKFCILEALILLLNIIIWKEVIMLILE